MTISPWFYLIFTFFVVLLLLADLLVFHRKPHAVSLREAGLWSAFWIVLALLFNIGVWSVLGGQKGLEFLTGYLIEKSLSVDNIFVFVLLFSAFAVPKEYQHRVLFIGVLSALIMRGIMIGIGAYLVSQFQWVLFIFGLFLLFAAFRMLTSKEEEEIEVEKNVVVRLVRKVFPVTPRYYGQSFFVMLDGRVYATPLLIVVAVVEATDLMFALDSIPAIFAITTDPFIVYTSNVFAILGLRALYFLLAGVVDRFHLLRYGLAIVLGFIGLKLVGAVIGHLEIAGREIDLHIPTAVSLTVVATVLLVATVGSLLFPPRQRRAAHHGPENAPLLGDAGSSDGAAGAAERAAARVPSAHSGERP
ncbi:MAG: TerC family protein [Chloroflexota bacterium]|nr:TerC family protein [Dehalococcoidia bacterium]MDW8253034.1 TerC family protein [Chloroflexota bacterium]